MQEVTSSLSNAIDSDEIDLEPVVEVDWELDGYDGPGTIDELSNQISTVEVKHGLYDGLPDEIAQLESSSSPTLTATVGGGKDADGKELSAAQYWSPFNSRSPLAGRTRDVALVRAQLAIVTGDGVERVQLFEGVMQGTPVAASGRARLQATSLTRLLLSQAVRLPVVATNPSATTQGLVISRDDEIGTTWVVSWILYVCGVYASPPPVSGCFQRYPLHCGHVPFSTGGEIAGSVDLPLISVDPPSTSLQIAQTSTGLATYVPSRPLWVPGPFVAGADAFWESGGVVDGIYRMVKMFPSAPAGEHWFDISGNKGRAEFYIRGDVIPDGYQHPEFPSPNALSDAAVLLRLLRSGSGLDVVLTGQVLATTRKLRLTFTNASGVTTTLHSSSSVPEDGLWHSVGFAWDVDNRQMWTYLDGEVDTANNLSMSSSGMGGAFESYALYSVLPLSEVQFSAGVSPADFDTWMGDEGWWTQTASVFPAIHSSIDALVESRPREAYELLQALAKAERSTITIDEHDIYRHRAPGWDATPAGQTPVETIATDRKAAVPDVSLPATRIRNIIRVSYQRNIRFVTPTSFSFVLFSTAVYELPPGESTLTIRLDTLAAGFETTQLWVGQTFNILSAATLASIVAGSTELDPLVALLWHGVFLNTLASGGGSLISTNVTLTVAEITSDSIVITVQNDWGFSVYTAVDASTPDNVRIPTMTVVAMHVEPVDDSAIDLDDTSFEQRGPRVLMADADFIDNPLSALRLVRQLLTTASRPAAVVSRMEAFGDPRRQPGDLVRITDEDETGLDELMRVRQVTHKMAAGSYTQTILAEEYRPVGVWGQSRWGDGSVWAATDNPGIFGRDAV